MSLKQSLKRIGLILLCLVLLVSGCSRNTAVVPDEPEEEPEEESIQEAIKRAASSGADTRFTVLYDSASPLTPMRATNIYNQSIARLLYEGLTWLDENMEPQPLLAKEWQTEDGKTWHFTLQSGVTFHNGEIMTAEDVVYSLSVAERSSRYKSRFSSIKSITVEEDLKIKIVLSAVNYNFPALLDVGIFQRETDNDEHPSGTGPYMLTEISGATVLYAFDKYWRGATQQQRIIFLSDDMTKIADDFATEVLDCFVYDPSGNTQIYIQRDCDIRYFDTTRLTYIGFNLNSDLMDRSVVRHAISYAVDREYMLETVLHHHARNAPLALSPALSYYGEYLSGLEESVGYSVEDMCTLFAELGLSDADADGWLEIGSGERWSKWSIDFIVNEDNSFRVAIAEQITATLQSVGVNITLRILPWSDYKKALNKGEFDMYMAELQLAPDFDLSPILAVKGSANYGKLTNTDYQEQIAAFLAAGEDTRGEAAQTLCMTILDNVPIIPLYYKYYAVYSHRGTISNFTPSISNPFGDVLDWIVKTN